MRTTSNQPAPFDAIADEYDARFTNSAIGRAQRQSVWQEAHRVFRPGQRVLEINCGTGVDAMHLAAAGLSVVACDASPRMIDVARRRRQASPYRGRVDLRVVPIEGIGELAVEGPFDGVFSNFAGLNCVADLHSVAGDLARLVKPGGRAVLCMFGRTCLWEILWYSVHGQFAKAWRRMRSGGTKARLAPGHHVSVRYPSIAALGRDFSPHFRLRGWKGVGVAVPPSYLEPWAARFSRLFIFAARLDRLLGRCPGFRSLADHMVLVLERVRT